MRCPDCGAEVSPLRDACPRCGASTDRLFDRLDQSRERSPSELARNRKTVFAIGGGVLLLAAVMGNIHPFGRHLSVSPGVIKIDTRNEPKEPVTIDAAELFEAYHKDSGAADRRFGGREMVVTGEFLRTVPDGYGSIDMRLKTDHPDTPLGIDLDSHSVDAATKLEAGETVTLSCRKVAGWGDDPWLQDCVLQPPAEIEPESLAPRPPNGRTSPRPPGPPAPTPG
ncbi:MAG: hypothetical protein ACTHKE_01300 [Sphingomicrobium sp.]